MRQLREGAGLTQEALGKKLGVGRRRVGEWERRRKLWGPVAVAAYCVAHHHKHGRP